MKKKTPKAKRKAPRKSVPQLVVRDYDWGCLYEGTKEAFISSGLVTAKRFPKSTKRADDTYCDCGGDDRSRRVEWSYENGVWRAWVKYNIFEIAPSKIIEMAQQAISNAMAQLHYDISECKPRPLSETLGIRAAHDKFRYEK